MADLLFRFTAHVRASHAPGPLSLTAHGRKFVFHGASPRLSRLVSLLQEGAHTSEQLVAHALETPGPDDADRLGRFIQKLNGLGLLSWTLARDEHPLLTLVPLTSEATLPPVNVDPLQPHGLSRFAHVRAEQGRLVLESPLSLWRVELLHPGLLALVERLSRCQPLDALRGGLPPELGAGLPDLLRLLVGAGFVGEGEAGAPHAGEDAELQQWEFHDLLFHARSRTGRHDGPVGRTYRFLGKREPQPALRPGFGAPVIELYRPDLEHLSAKDKPFTTVLEQRRSVRRFGAKPPTLTQLGEFLFRAARVRHVIERDGQSYLYESSDRPYPGGGGCYELELYVVVNACEGLAGGIYHYDPLNHRLSTVPGGEAAREPLLAEAALANGSGLRPQLLIVLTARFPRMLWKYQTMGYAAILKDVGVLYQSMYLVATAMGLAPCAVGVGNPEPLRAVTGDRYWAESSVGEFMLGSLPEEVEPEAPGLSAAPRPPR